MSRKAIPYWNNKPKKEKKGRLKYWSIMGASTKGEIYGEELEEADAIMNGADVVMELKEKETEKEDYYQYKWLVAPFINDKWLGTFYVCKDVGVLQTVRDPKPYLIPPVEIIAENGEIIPIADLLITADGKLMQKA